MDEGIDRLVVSGSGREVESGSTEDIFGHEVLSVPVINLLDAYECVKQLVI